MYFLIREFKPQEGIKIILKIMIGYGIISSIYGIFQFFFWENIPFEAFFLQNPKGVYFQDFLKKSGLRVFSFSTGDMGFFFPLVAFTIILIITGSRWLDSKWIKLRNMFYVFFFSLLALSLVRTPIAMLVIGVLSAILMRERLSSFLKRGIVVILVVIAGSYVFNIASPILKATGNVTLIRFAELSNPFQANTFVGRRDKIWPIALQTIRVNPMGTGVGTGRRTRAATSLGSQYILPHNDFLLRFVEGGIIGGLVFIFILFYIARGSISNIHKATDDFTRDLNRGLVGTLICFAACGMVNIPFDVESGLAFWLLVSSARYTCDGKPHQK